MLSSRRGFFTTAAVALSSVGFARRSGQGGLDQFASHAAPACKTKTLTPAVSPDSTYRAGSPATTSLVPRGATGVRLVLSGTVSGLACGVIKGATVDFWQPDARGGAQATILRGHQLTAADGTFHLDTVVPGLVPGRARRIGVNVRVPGKTNFWTAAFFPDDPNRTRDPAYRPDLTLALTRNGDAETATFDIVLNL